MAVSSIIDVVSLSSTQHSSAVHPFYDFTSSLICHLVPQSSGGTSPKTSSGRPRTQVHFSTIISMWQREKSSSSAWKELLPTSATMCLTATSTRGNWETKWHSTGQYVYVCNLWYSRSNHMTNSLFIMHKDDCYLSCPFTPLDKCDISGLKCSFLVHIHWCVHACLEDLCCLCEYKGIE